MADDKNILLKLKLLDEYSAELKKFSSGVKQAESSTKGSSQSMVGNFLSVKNAVMGLAGSAAVGALVKGLTAVVNAASEGEQAAVRLSAALKAQSLYTEAAVDDVREWSKELLKSKGVNDELATTLVAQGVVMGLSIERSKEFVSMAKDMEDIVGSETAAFDALSRAATGDERAIKSLGKQFGIATDEGTRLNDILAQIAGKVDGNAAAKVHTFKGEWGLLFEEIGDGLEEHGTPLMEWLTKQPDEIRRAAAAWREFGSAASEAFAIETAAISWLKENANLDTIFGFKHAREEASKLATVMSQLVKSHGVQSETVSSHDSENRYTTKGRGKFYEYTDLEAGISRRKSAREKAETEESALRDRSMSLYDTPEKLMEADIKKAKDDLARETIEFFGDIEELLGEQAALQERLTGGETFGPTRETAVAAIADETEAFFADFERLQTAEQQKNKLALLLANLEIEWDEVERKNKEKAHKKSLEAAQAQLNNATEFVSFAEGVVNQLASGDYTSALKSALTTFFGQYGQIASSVIGIVQTLLNDEPRTEGGQAREALRDLLKDELGGGQLADALTDAELGGMADFWADLAEQITGYSGGGQGNILAAQFTDLGLSVGQTIDAVGGLIAAANDLTEAEGDQAAAAAALLSITDFTTSELGELAQAYGDATNFLEQKVDLEERILESAQAYADATGSAKDDALKQLEADRAEYLALVVDEAEQQKKSDDELLAALEGTGMSTEEAKELVNSQKSATEIAAKQLTVLESIASALGSSVPAYHSGSEHLAMVRNDELIAPPEKFREARDYLNQSLGDSGGGSRTIVLTLDGKTVAKVVDGHTRAMQRTKEIAA